MSIKTYLWIEDCKGKSSYVFWERMMKMLYPNVIVESKRNNSELVKAVKKLNDSNNRYIIVFDNSFDNLQVCQERKILEKYTRERNNIALLDIICFEYILLEFEKLIEWIYTTDDEFLVKRANTINIRNKIVKIIQSDYNYYKDIQEIIEYDNNISEHNIEQFSAKLLFDLTRNTGFEVSKGKIGECWIESCCDWNGRQEDDVCGLDYKRLNIKDKMVEIYNGTSLKEKFLEIGLELII